MTDSQTILALQNLQEIIPRLQLYYHVTQPHDDSDCCWLKWSAHLRDVQDFENAHISWCASVGSKLQRNGGDIGFRLDLTFIHWYK